MTFPSCIAITNPKNAKIFIEIEKNIEIAKIIRKVNKSKRDI